MFLQFFHTRSQDLFHQAVDDLDTGQITLVHRAIGGLARKRLLVQRAIGIAVKETAYLVFQLANAHHSLFAQPPGHILIGQPFAAIDRIHKVPLDRIAAAKRNVIAALHHPCAAALSDQPFDSNRDLGSFRRGLLGVQGREQPRAASAEDQDISIVPIYVRDAHLTPPLAKRGLRSETPRPLHLRPVIFAAASKAAIPSPSGASRQTYAPQAERPIQTRPV